jgi:hypothetical protein
MTEGVVDAAVRDNYTMEILVGSQLAPVSDQPNLRSESNRAHINGAVIRVTDANGGAIGEFTSIASGFVDPGQNNAASYGLAGVTALDAPTLQKAAAGVAAGTNRLVVANVKVFGKTLGGQDVESGEFQFPIRVCNGCLIDFSTGDGPADGLDCTQPLTTTTTTGTAVVIPCNAGQDEATPCQLCRDRKAACNGQ